MLDCQNQRQLQLSVSLTHSVDFSQTLRELISWLDSTQMQLDHISNVDYVGLQKGNLISSFRKFKVKVQCRLTNKYFQIIY